MSKQIRYAVGLMLLTVVSASAQITQQIRVNVPFSFSAAGKNHPAGNYALEFNKERNLLTLSGYGSTPAILPTVASSEYKGEPTNLRFQRYGADWFLQEVTFSGTGQELTPSKMERELARSKPADERILVAKVSR